MSQLLQHLLPFVPPHLARKLILHPEWEEQVDSDVIPCALLFADISGFTPLTELLGQAGKEGPEELTRLLNETFNQLIDDIRSEAGEVVKFSGDALMVVFPAEEQSLSEAVRRARQAADRIQESVATVGDLDTSAGKQRLEMKVGIGCGDLLTMEVGGLLGRWEYVVAGEPVEQAAAAEARARPGDIVLSEQAQAVIHEGALEPRIVETLSSPMMERMDQVEKSLRRFVPGAVLGWLDTGSSSWMGVLRPMTVLFIGVKDYDFSADGALETFHELVRNVQRTLYRFEGSLNKVAVDDKGTVVMALFGAPPLAHQDDAERGVKAAMEIRELAAKMKIELAVGVTTGQVFAGPVGSEKRFEYTVMGESVNLATRLMKAAGPGGILCDQPTRRGVGERIRMSELEPIRVKGVAREVPIYRPDDVSLTSRLISGSFRPPSMMVGREEETALIKASLARLRQGKGTVLLVEAGAGMGKTRLLREIAMQSKIQGLPCFRGEGRGTEKQTQFLAWQQVFEQLFQLDQESEPRERYAKVHALLSELAPACLDQVALLQEWLNLTMPSGTQEIVLDAESRDFSLMQLLTGLVRAWTDTRPLIVLLDGGQWLDGWSWRLALKLAESVAETQHPLLLALATRPMDREIEQSRLMERLSALSCCTLRPLHALERDDLTLMIADRLQLLPRNVPGRLVQFIHQRSEGSPFVAEELLRAMQDQEMLEVWRDEQSNQNKCRLVGRMTGQTESLPGSVRGLILARLDRLSADQQRTLKVASVFGRRFSFDALVEVMQEGQGFEPRVVQRHLDSFVDMDLLEVESDDPELVYRFRHRVTQEVAYDSMLFSHRRELHETAAKWLERRYGGDQLDTGTIASLCPETSPLTPWFSDLARHYRAAGNRDRELLYSVLAGRRAALLYQNEEAEELFSRALDLLPEEAWSDRYELLRDRERIHTVMSRRAARKADLQTMQECARQLDDSARKGDVAVLQAIYQYAHGRARSAERLCQSAIKLAGEAKSAEVEARARRWLGAALQSQGNHQKARQEMERARDIARDAGLESLATEITTELARFAEKRGEFTTCLEFCEQALPLARQAGDLGNEARILRRMASAQLARGDHEASARLAREAEELQRQIGDLRQESVTLDLRGRIAMAQGDHATAKASFERSLALRQRIEDHAGQHHSLMLLGEALLNLGAFEKARICYEQALEDAQAMDLAFSQAEINSRLVLLEHAVGDNEKAKHHGLEAARKLSALNDLPLLATTLTHLGEALTELEEYDSAAAAYGNAIRIRIHLGQKELLMETVACQAQLDFKRGRLDQAREKIDEVLAHFGDRPIGGVLKPFRIYQICFEVLDALEDKRAPGLIERAHEHLQQLADAISDSRLRESFLQSVMENRAVAYYYQRLQRPQPRSEDEG